MSEPLVPVTVIVTFAKLAPDDVIVSVEDEVAGFGENVPVTCAGKPLTLRLTGPEKPLLGVIVTVYVVVPDEPTKRDEGEMLIEKSPARGVADTSLDLPPSPDPFTAVT